MSGAAVAILTFVTVQRLAELLLANRNTRRLLAEGAVEHGERHYPLLIALHTGWLICLWWWAPGRPIEIPVIILFAVLQLGRVWVIASLGRRWTTRIITVPEAALVRSGPFRFVDHPNYLIVSLEIAVLPLAFGLVEFALAFSVLNAIVLSVRIRAEENALKSLRR